MTVSEDVLHGTIKAVMEDIEDQLDSKKAELEEAITAYRADYIKQEAAIRGIPVSARKRVVSNLRTEIHQLEEQLARMDHLKREVESGKPGLVQKLQEELDI